MVGRKNPAAGRTRARGSSRPAIGFLTHSLSDSYGALLWQGVMDAAREADVNLVCYPGWAIRDERGFNKQANVLYELVNKDRLDGLVISSGALGNYVGRDGLQQFCETFRPLPMASIAVELEGIPSVVVENRLRMGELVNHLIRDHRISRFVFVSGPEGNEEARQRHKGFVEALDQHGLAPACVTPSAGWEDNSGEAAVRFLLDEQHLAAGQDFQAIVTCSDNVAYGVLAALQARGISVPEQVLLTGFDDQERMEVLTPPLTTVHQPLREQARLALNAVLDQIAHRKVNQVITLPTEVVRRQSCGCMDEDIAEARNDITGPLNQVTRRPLRNQRQEILSRMTSAAHTRAAAAGKTERLWDSFLADIEGPAPTAGFLTTLDGVLKQATLDQEDVFSWQKVISAMRREMAPRIEDPATRGRAEDLWQHARIMIGKRAQRAQGYRQLERQQRHAILDGINHLLATTSHADQLKEFLPAGLGQLKIPACFVSLYENPVVPAGGCRMILAYQDDQLAPAGTNTLYAARDLLPAGLLPAGRRFNLILEPLYFRENQIGLIVFEVGPEEGMVYETLRGHLSSALWAARLVEYLGSLHEASNEIMALEEPREILKKVVEKVCDIVRAKCANAVLIDKDGRPTRIVLGGDCSGALPAADLAPLDGIVADVATRDDALFIDDVAQAGPAYHAVARAGIGALACLPLHLTGKSSGAIWVYFERPHHFPSAEKNALRLYVNQAAATYDNARRMQELEHLRQATENLAQVAEVRDVLQQIVRSAREVLQADSAVIWSYDSERRMILTNELVADGVDPGILQKFNEEEPRPDGTASIVIRLGYLAVTDVDDPRFDYLNTPARGLRNEIGVKSFQGISLQVEDKPLGVLYVNYNHKQGFDEEDQYILKSFAYHAALALKKARLLEQVKRVHNTARIIAGLSVTKDLRHTLQSAVDGTKDVLNCDAVLLYIYNQGRNQLDHPPVMTGVRFPERAKSAGTVLQNSVVYRMLLRDSPKIADVVSRDEDFSDRRFAIDEEIESCMAIPLLAGGKRVGVMFVNYRTRHRFTGEELTDIQIFTHQAAEAIYDAQAHQEIKKKTASWETLYEAGKVVTSSLALDEILGSIVRQASLLTSRAGGKQAHYCHLALKEHRTLRFKATFSSPEASNTPVKITQVINLDGAERIGVVGRAVEKGESQLVDNIEGDPDYIEDNPETRSLLAVPILIEREVLGVIGVEHSDLAAFDIEDQQALEALASQAAIAIQNARRFEELQRVQGLVGSRTALAWMGMASSTWRHTIDKHALTIAEQTDLLSEDLQRLVTPQQDPRLFDRLSMIRRLARQIEAKPITPPLSAEEGVVSVQVNGLIRERVKQLAENGSYDGIRLHMHLMPNDGRTVRASPEWLRRALDILIENGREAMTESPVKDLTIETAQVDGHLEVLIRDTGAGILEHERSRLFLLPIEKSPGTKGMGMGLLMAHAIVQTYGGEIGVGSSDASGTTMCIRIPFET